jgi:hypothetical protein
MRHTTPGTCEMPVIGNVLHTLQGGGGETGEESASWDSLAKLESQFCRLLGKDPVINAAMVLLSLPEMYAENH